MDFDAMMSAMDSSSGEFDEQLRLRVNDAVNSISRSPSAKVSTDRAPNFSRKISSDVGPQQTDPMDYYPYQNVVQIKAQKEAIAREDKQSKLRKVLSGWMTKKEKKEDWMQKVEKKGIKEGIMIQEEPALPPVIRY